jgi:DNA-directed RNA polymerase specialized sigma24 family protein
VNANALNNGAQFSTTRWSVVLLAGRTRSPETTAALEKLCRAYWPPIYCFARRKGWNDADAQDLTQQFFAHLLARNDFSGVDPRKGKFRTFLLTAFTHFLANEYDRTRALKRGGGFTILSLDALPLEETGELAPAGNVSPDTQYDLRWAKTILATALKHLSEEMVTNAKPGWFAQLKPFLTINAAPGDYAAVAGRLDVAEVSVPVLVHRLRQRYRELVRAEVAQTVTCPA